MICAMDLYLYYYYLISCKHTSLLLAWENRVMYNTDRTARRKSSLRTARHRAGSTAVSERPRLPTLGGLGHTCSTFNFSPQPPRKTKASETPFFSLSFPKISPPNFVSLPLYKQRQSTSVFYDFPERPAERRYCTHAFRHRHHFLLSTLQTQIS